MSSEQYEIRQIKSEPKTILCAVCLGRGTLQDRSSSNCHRAYIPYSACCGKGEIEFPKVKQ